MQSDCDARYKAIMSYHAKAMRPEIHTLGQKKITNPWGPSVYRLICHFSTLVSNVFTTFIDAFLCANN